MSEFIKEKTVYEAEDNTYYIVADCDRRTNTIVYYDGANWYFPGSELAFPTTDFISDITTGRFVLLEKIKVPHHAYGPWKIEYGRSK